MAAAQVYLYEAYGLRIRSEVQLPELHPVIGRDEQEADLLIRLAEIVRDLPDNSVEVEDGKLYIKVRDAALYCIEGGHTVTISCTGDSSVEKMRLYLLGTCMGAVLLQRGMLPLHGSAAAVDGKAYVFIGDSGAGKSTLAAALQHRGACLISDDVAAVSWDARGIPYVAYAYPQQRLRQESLEHFGMDSKRYASVPMDEAKYAVPVPFLRERRPLPLGGVYELCTSSDAGAVPRIVEIGKLESIHLLLFHTYRRALVQRLGLKQRHFAQAVSLLKYASVKRLVRPEQRMTIEQTATAVWDDIREWKEEVL